MSWPVEGVGVDWRWMFGVSDVSDVVVVGVNRVNLYLISLIWVVNLRR